MVASAAAPPVLRSSTVNPSSAEAMGASCGRMHGSGRASASSLDNKAIVWHLSAAGRVARTGLGCSAGLRDAMARLACSPDRVKARYDVLVVGSGYGGGVAASRLARAGKRVAVLERGREFLTGEFPSRFPDLRGEVQLTGKRLRMGTPTGLYDVRFGEDMHVLVGCGLGGGSLINAGVALRPGERVLLGRRWRDEVVRDGWLAEGDARAIRWLRPSADPTAVERRKYQALDRASLALGKAPVRAPVVVGFEATVNPAGVAQPACIRCGDCCGGCNI